MIKFRYGSKEDFTSFKSGVKLKDAEVQELIDDVCKELYQDYINGSSPEYHYQGTGDTMVFGFEYDEDNDGKIDAFDIFVCRGYDEASAWVSEGKINQMNWGSEVSCLTEEEPKLEFKRPKENKLSLCPVCSGRGFVSSGFYSSTGNTWVSSTTAPEQCRSCYGKGYIIIAEESGRFFNDKYL